ncbi:MAG: TVP38/TMEM64 family protein [Gammaproteobacteria bacterium]
MRRALWRLTALGLLAGLAYALWLYSPLQEWTETERLASLLQDLGVSPWAGIVVLIAYLIGSFIVFPVTALIAATGVALGPINGMIWATAGCLLAATVNYCCARRLSAETLDNWTGGWLRRLGHKLEHGGIVSVMVARNIPIAPFTVVNVVAGAASIPFRDYLVGTVLGLGPTIAALTILGDRLRGAWEAPTALNIGLLTLAIALWFAVAVGLQALSNRYASAS